jgi:hypothetical protein
MCMGFIWSEDVMHLNFILLSSDNCLSCEIEACEYATTNSWSWPLIQVVWLPIGRRRFRSWLTYAKEVVRSSVWCLAACEREKNILHSKTNFPLDWRGHLWCFLSVKEEFTNRHQSDYLLLSKLIRRVMHSRVILSLCERIVEGRSKDYS